MACSGTRSPAAHALDFDEGVSKRRHEDRAEPGFRPAGRLDELAAVRSGVSARSHDFKIRREGGFRSASARTTCQARWPASVTPYWPASLFARSPSDWSFWRWKESLDDESTKFFLRIDTGDVRFDRGVELIELVRCEGDRWTAPLLRLGRRGSRRTADPREALRPPTRHVGP